jgi:enterochelin esterase-like enzyme
VKQPAAEPATAEQVAQANLDSTSEDETLPTATDIPATATLAPTATATATATPVPSPTPCALPGQVETGYFDSIYAGRINYRVYLPPCYSDSGRTYPTLYMLPGNIYTDSIWDELGLDEAAEAGIRDKSIPPMLIAMLSGGSLANTTSGGPGSYESFMLEEFIPYFEGNYCAMPNSSGRAIGGMSRGGYWALEIAFRHPDEFISVGGHSAALVDFNGGPTINPSDTGLSNDLGNLRIYLDIGENDWLLFNVQQLHEEMAAEERPHIWILNQGIHEEAYWAAHLEEYLDWYAEPWLDFSDYPPCRAISSGYSP